MSKRKFKVGDKVKYVRGYGQPHLKECMGKIGIIVGVNKVNTLWPYQVRFKWSRRKNGIPCNAQELELAK